MGKLTGAYNYNAICDVCGFKYKASELRKRWDGAMCCPEDWEPRHSLDFYKPRNDTHTLPFILPDDTKTPYLVTGVWDNGGQGILSTDTITDDSNAYQIEATPTSDWTTNTTTDAWTMMAWIKPLSLVNRFSTIFSTRGVGTLGSWSFDLGGTDGAVVTRGAMATRTNNVGTAVIGPRSLHGAIIPGIWQHIAITRDSSGAFQMFINGEQASFVKQAANGLLGWLGNSDTVYIGRPFTTNNSRNYYGGLKDIRIFNVAKTQIQVQRHMNDFNDFSSTETGLIGWWKLNEGSGSTIADSQTNYSPMNFTITNATNVTWDYDER